MGLPTLKCHFIRFRDGSNAKTLPVIVEIYITPFEKRGDETVGPTSVTHKREGLRGILDAEIPVRIEFPRNILHEPLSDIPNDFFNNPNSHYSMIRDFFYASLDLGSFWIHLRGS